MTGEHLDVGGAGPTVLTASVADLVGRARELAGEPGTRTVLGITGAPGAGKSTLTDAIRANLGPDRVAVVPMDGFHLANEVLDDLGRRQRKGAWDTFDVAGYVALLQRLRTMDDEVVYAPAFDRSIETSIGSALAVPRSVPLVITEGNYLLHDSGGWERVGPLLDVAWFVDVAEDERVRRLVGRRTGDGEDVDRARSWVLDVDLVNAELVLPGAARADLCLSLLAPDHETRRAR